MAYFLHHGGAHEDRLQGKRMVTTRAPDNNVLNPERAKKPILSRDDLVDVAIAKINSSSTEDFLTKKLQGLDINPRGKGMKTEGTRNNAHNHIFSPDEPTVQPAPRWHQHVPEDQLRRLMGNPDSRRAEAAELMSQDVPMVEKMDGDRNYHPAFAIHKFDNVASRRKSYTNYFMGKKEPETIKVAVMGFPGMGAQCKDTPRGGRNCRPVGDFVPDPPVVLSGRRKKSIIDPITGGKVGQYTPR